MNKHLKAQSVEWVCVCLNACLKFRWYVFICTCPFHFDSKLHNSVLYGEADLKWLQGISNINQPTNSMYEGNGAGILIERLCAHFIQIHANATHAYGSRPKQFEIGLFPLFLFRLKMCDYLWFVYSSRRQCAAEWPICQLIASERVTHLHIFRVFILLLISILSF